MTMTFDNGVVSSTELCLAAPRVIECFDGLENILECSDVLCRINDLPESPRGAPAVFLLHHNHTTLPFISQGTQVEEKSGLWPLGYKVGKENAGDPGCRYVSDFPREQRSTMQCRRLLYACRTAECLLEKIADIGRYLLEANTLLKRRASSIPLDAQAVCVAFNGEVAICVQGSG